MVKDTQVRSLPDQPITLSDAGRIETPLGSMVRLHAWKVWFESRMGNQNNRRLKVIGVLFFSQSFVVISPIRLTWHGTSFGMRNNGGSNPSSETSRKCKADIKCLLFQGMVPSGRRLVLETRI